MLSQADAQIAARDAAIPGIACVLDPEALADGLRRALPHAAISEVHPTYVRYKPGTSCVVGLRLTGPDGEIDAYAKAHHGGDAEKVAKAVARARAPGPWGAGAVQLAHEVVVSFFPNDRGLRVAGVLSDPRRRHDLLARLLPDRPDTWNGELRALRYKPERRYVARLDGPRGPAAILRCYGPEDFEQAQASALAFSSDGLVRVAGVLGASERHRVLALEWLDPGPLPVGLSQRSCPAGAFEAVGQALAWLHRQPAAGLRVLDRSEEASLLDPAADAVAAVVPRLGGEARSLAARLGSALRSLPAMRVPIHGDFSADQVVLSADGVAIIDYDAARLGDPVSDLGLFRATLLVDVLRGHLHAVEGERRTQVLIDGYRSAAPGRRVATERLDLYTAVWLVRLAVEPFRRRMPEWPGLTEAVLREATAWWRP